MACIMSLTISKTIERNRIILLYMVFATFLIIYPIRSTMADDIDWGACQESLERLFSKTNRIIHLPNSSGRIYIYAPDGLRERIKQTMEEWSQLIGIKTEYISDANEASVIFIITKNFFKDVLESEDLLRLFDREDGGANTYSQLKGAARAELSYINHYGEDFFGDWFQLIILRNNSLEKKYHLVEDLILKIFFPEIDSEEIISRYKYNSYSKPKLIDLIIKSEKCALQKVIIGDKHHLADLKDVRLIP